MGLKNIFDAFNNKKNGKQDKESNNKESSMLKKGSSFEKMDIKSILKEFKDQEKAKNSEADKVIKKKIYVDNFMDKVIISAFEKLITEFEEVGGERKAQLTTNALQSSLTVFCNDDTEYIYKISIENEDRPGNGNELKINLITFLYNSDNVPSNGKKEIIFAGKKINNISEEDIRNDFYTRYRDYLLARE